MLAHFDTATHACIHSDIICGMIQLRFGRTFTVEQILGVLYWNGGETETSLSPAHARPLVMSCVRALFHSVTPSDPCRATRSFILGVFFLIFFFIVFCYMRLYRCSGDEDATMADLEVHRVHPAKRPEWTQAEKAAFASAHRCVSSRNIALITSSLS